MVLLPVALAVTPRIELPLAEAVDPEVLASAGGLLIVSRARGDRRTLRFDGHGPDAAPLFRTAHTPERGGRIVDAAIDDHHAWLLLGRNQESSAVRVDLRTGSIASSPVLATYRGQVEKIVTDGRGGAWVSGRRRRRGTLSYMTPTGSSHPVHLPWAGEVVDLQSGGGGRAQAVVEPRRNRGTLRIVDLENGEVTAQTDLTPRGRHALVDARIVQVPGASYAIGTFTTQSTGLANGLFIAALEDGLQTSYDSWTWGELDHAFAHRGTRRASRTTERLARRREAGRRSDVAWNLLLLDPVVTADRIVFAAEASEPQTHVRTETISIPDGRGGIILQTRQVTEFLGWQSTHGLVVAFDHAGRRLVDRSLRLTSAVDRVRRPHLHVRADAEGIDVLHAGRGRVHVTRLTEDDPPETVVEEPLHRDRIDGVVWWHDDRFLQYGRARDGMLGAGVFFVEVLEVE
jgi:hypothetical protein